jgi:class 3 adenylate cyclase
MFDSDSNTFTFNTREHVMYSRRSIMRRVTYLLLVITLLQSFKWIFLPEAVAAEYSFPLLVFNTVLHLFAFGLCLYLFKRKLFNLGKWVLQLAFISFITTANLLWYNDIALQYFYLLAIFISGFMFSERETRYFGVFCFLYLSLFLVFQYLYMAALSYAPSEMILPMLNSVILAVSCFGCAWIVRKMTLSNWKKAQNFAQSNSQSNLIYKVFPERIAGKLISLQANRQTPAQDLMYQASMTVVFLDILNTKRYMQEYGAEKASQLLDSIFEAFNAEIKSAGCLRIKTHGDQYIFVRELKQGLHAAQVCKCLNVVRELHRIFYKHAKGTDLVIRCGVASGEASAGVVNLGSPCFDVWGQVVVLASRLEKSCQPMHVHCDEETHRLASERFYFKPSSEWNFKGLGKIMTYQMLLAE